jgi:hypothetical protein
MDVSELSFVKITRLKDDVIEVEVFDGVEIDLAMIEEYHQWILHNLKHPCYILVDKVHDYTYSFAAQRVLSTLAEIRAIAILVHSRTSELATQALIKVPKERPWNSRIFHSRQEALDWLESQRPAAD